MHPIESELIKVTKYKARTKFANRQDYLGSILNAVMKLADDAFDNLSDEAAEWANAAVDARNSKSDELPDFDELKPSDEADDAADEEAADEDEDSPPTKNGVADEEGDDGEDDDGDADEDGEETDPDDEDDAPEDEEGDDPEEAPVKKSSKKAAPKAVKLKPPPKEKKAPAKRAPSNDEDVVLDKWGCIPGSKNAQALAMFEKGATSREIKEELGGTYYNILKKKQLAGHIVEKNGSVIKLTHKDEVKAAKAAPKKGKK
jgi:hypothetical protein